MAICKVSDCGDRVEQPNAVAIDPFAGYRLVDGNRTLEHWLFALVKEHVREVLVPIGE